MESREWRVKSGEVRRCHGAICHQNAVSPGSRSRVGLPPCRTSVRFRQSLCRAAISSSPRSVQQANPTTIRHHSSFIAHETHTHAPCFLATNPQLSSAGLSERARAGGLGGLDNYEIRIRAAGESSSIRLAGGYVPGSCNGANTVG